jgi:energy-coupling factor transporter transmembrane protein EcfT
MSLFHPAVRLLAWAAAAVAVQFAIGTPLVLFLLVALVAGLLYARGRSLRLLRRARWLLLAVVVLFALATPGVLLLPELGRWGPTDAGVELGAIHIARLLVVLTSLALLLELTPPPALVGALYDMMTPLATLGVDRARIAVRLMLVMHYAEDARQRGWRDWVAPAADEDRPERILIERLPLRAADRLALLLLGVAAVAWAA